MKRYAVRKTNFYRLINSCNSVVLTALIVKPGLPWRQDNLKVVRKPGVKGGSSSWQGKPYLLNPLHYLEPDIAKGIVACDMQVPAASHGKGKNGAPFITRAVPV